MGLFENVVQTARTAAKTVGKKAEEVIDLSKRKLNVSELEDKLEEAFGELGEIYYKVLKGETVQDGETEDIVNKIEDLKQQLEDAREELAKLSQKSVCPACGAECETSSVFCSKCGAKMNEE